MKTNSRPSRNKRQIDPETWGIPGARRGSVDYRLMDSYWKELREFLRTASQRHRPTDEESEG